MYCLKTVYTPPKRGCGENLPSPRASTMVTYIGTRLKTKHVFFQKCIVLGAQTCSYYLMGYPDPTTRMLFHKCVVLCNSQLGRQGCPNTQTFYLFRHILLRVNFTCPYGMGCGSPSTFVVLLSVSNLFSP